ncbi:hypothetical protein GQ53DRAFT_105188 [Thozetella sp. PMI_491]|nr:hypothetical protein GQ53DRAFT_105188 [Thozetella sp. PMI_491]
MQTPAASCTVALVAGRQGPCLYPGGGWRVHASRDVAGVADRRSSAAISPVDLLRSSLAGSPMAVVTRDPGVFGS